MFSSQLVSALDKDKNLFFDPELAVITVYDDNFFVRNDYDVLSVGQRNYVINFFKPFNFKQKSGRILTDGVIKIEFPKPNRILAISAFQPEFIVSAEQHLYVVTPSTYAEALFYKYQSNAELLLDKLKTLINTCPFNIELTRDINYHTAIEQITINTYQHLLNYQKQVIEEKFKFKRTL